MSMLGNPLGQFNIEPKAMNSERNACEEPPFYPISKQLDSFPIKIQAPPINDGMLDFPVIHDT